MFYPRGSRDEEITRDKRASKIAELIWNVYFKVNY